MSADPLTLALSFLPQGNLPPPPEAGQVLQSMLDVNPAVGYGQGGLYAKAPEQVSENPAYNAAHNLGRLFQGGSGVEGTLGGTGSVVASTLSDLPSHADALGMFLPVSQLTELPYHKLPEYLDRTAQASKLDAADYVDELRNVFKATGFSRPTADLAPLYYVPSKDAGFTPEAEDVIRGLANKTQEDVVGAPLFDVLNFPELKDRMPSLRNQLIDLRQAAGEFGGGVYRAVGDKGINYSVGPANTMEDILRGVLHETSHVIDNRTGRAVSGTGDFTNPDRGAYDLIAEARPDLLAQWKKLKSTPAVRNTALALYMRNMSETLARLTEQMQLAFSNKGATPRTISVQNYTKQATGIRPYGNLAQQRLLRNVASPEEFVSVPHEQQIMRNSASPTTDLKLTPEERIEFLQDISAALSNQ